MHGNPRGEVTVDLSVPATLNVLSVPSCPYIFSLTLTMGREENSKIIDCNDIKKIGKRNGNIKQANEMKLEKVHFLLKMPCEC